MPTCKNCNGTGCCPICMGSGIVPIGATDPIPLDIKKLKFDIADDIECARDWLFPGRKVRQIEIDSCINELNDIIKRLKS